MGIDVFGRNTYGGGQWDVCERFSVFGSGHEGQLFPIGIILAELIQKKMHTSLFVLCFETGNQTTVVRYFQYTSTIFLQILSL
jgi:hypothetical protein